MEKKFGVYICKGCGIKEAMDVEKVAGAAKKVQNHKFHTSCAAPRAFS
jgi:heterodisulfide reductase subunit A-like polyferredoxin